MQFNLGVTLKTLVIALLLSFTALMHGQPTTRLKDTASARHLTDQMMEKVASGEIEAAMNIARPFLVIPDAELDSMIGQIRLQVPMMTMRFGKSVGSEFIREDKVGQSLMQIVHIHKFERHITRWIFYFYRTPTGWVLNTFNFDDNIKALF